MVLLLNHNYINPRVVQVELYFRPAPDAELCVLQVRIHKKLLAFFYVVLLISKICLGFVS